VLDGGDREHNHSVRLALIRAQPDKRTVSVRLQSVVCYKHLIKEHVIGEYQASILAACRVSNQWGIGNAASPGEIVAPGDAETV